MWFVGNENKDVEGANAAGSFSVLIDRRRRAPVHPSRKRASRGSANCFP
jgi:FMN phosphatase YigB (HAD superfamily)